MKRYTITLKTDLGLRRISTVAENEDKAKQIVCAAESAPLSAVKSCKEILQKIKTLDIVALEWYGGKQPHPVTVCAKWLHDAQAFISDMGPTHAPGLTLDRKDSNGPYSPENCRWIPLKAQQRNRSSNRIVVLNGTGQMCMTEAAERIGMNRHSLKGWLNRGGGYYQASDGQTVEDVVKK